MIYQLTPAKRVEESGDVLGKTDVLYGPCMRTCWIFWRPALGRFAEWLLDFHEQGLVFCRGYFFTFQGHSAECVLVEYILWKGTRKTACG